MSRTGRGGATALAGPAAGAGLVGLVGLLVTGCAATGPGTPADAPGSSRDRIAPMAAASTPAAGRPSGSPSGSPTGGGVSTFRSPRTYRTVAPPVRIRIPAGGIDSSLERVGLATDGTIAPPRAWQRAGWFEDGPRPGQQGRAVIVGHVDSKGGPAVFFRLDELRTGAKVHVDRADGSTATFRVRDRDRFAKAGFPADRVYSPTLETALVLITCGGTFDRATGHYRDNIVVTAVPA